MEEENTGMLLFSMTVGIFWYVLTVRPCYSKSSLLTNLGASGRPHLRKNLPLPLIASFYKVSTVLKNWPIVRVTVCVADLEGI